MNSSEKNCDALICQGSVYLFTLLYQVPIGNIIRISHRLDFKCPQLSSGMSWKWVLICVCMHFVLVLSCEYYKWNPLTNKETHHITALILARGGSKGIKLKNIAIIGDSTLLQISIRALKEVKGLSSIWVSTDHHLIAEEASKENVNIHWRSPDSATDSATSIFAVQEFLRNHLYVDVVCLVQCTSPFIKASYVQEAIKWMINKEECVFSVSRSYKLRWLDAGDKLVPLNFNPRKRPRRQEFRGELIENGMFYIATRKIIQSGAFQSNRYVLQQLCILYENFQLILFCKLEFDVNLQDL